MDKKYQDLLTTPIRTDRKPLHELLPLSSPLRVLIDPSDICNFKCSYCFQSCDKGFRGQIMEKKLFLQILEQLKEFDNPINIVHLFGLGEPMLNPDLPEFVYRLKESNVANEVAITSNGSKLTEDYSQSLIDAGLDRLSISLNGIEDRHFEKNVGTKVDFFKMYHQIQYFYNIRQQCHLHIKINGECFTEDEKDHFVELFKDYSDTLNIDHVVNVWSGITIKEQNSNETMYGLKPSNNIGRYICPQMFYEIMVHSDGSVSPCCVDYHYKKENLGNVKTETLKNIWNSSRLQQVRRDMITGKCSYEICKQCTYPTEAATVNLSPYKNELIEKYGL